MIALVPARKGSKRLPNKKVPKDLRRFWAQVEKSECWTWTGTLNRHGYGVYGKACWLAHRLAYTVLVGPIEAETLDHLCRNRSCVRPDHLEPVSRGENVRRGNPGQVYGAIQRSKTHCPQGHPYDEANTYLYGPKGYRECRACGRERARARYWESR